LKSTLSRSELARAAGVSPDTLRHYERKGVLPAPPRSSSGYRRYPLEAVVRVQLVTRALTVGFSLDELARVLREREKGGVPCRKVRALVEARFEALEARVRALIELRDELREVLNQWDRRLARTAVGEQARLLDGLVGRPAIEAQATARRSAAERAASLRAGSRRRRQPSARGG
jgi:DNA-binding transcriptional MerR regulator